MVGAYAQTTITTSHTNNNGNGSVTFNVHNTNVYDIIITDISCHLGTNASNNLQLLYNTTPINDPAPWNGGVIGDGQNGWILAGSAAVNSNTANGTVAAISNMSLVIPAGATYGLGFSGTTIQYMTLPAGVNTFTGGGVELITGDNVSWGGTAYPSTPANYPRGFIGGITFIPSVPCTSPPTAGTLSAGTNPICPSINNTISMTGGTGGTGQTYQWQSSTDGITFADIVGATNSTYIANQPAATYYQLIITCGGMSDTTAAYLVSMTPFTNCYCTQVPAFAGDEEIYNVTINGGSTDSLYANAAGCSTPAPGPGSVLNRYSNFKTLAPITTVAPGQVVSFAIDENECDGATYYACGISMWIDYNQNGLYTDPGEQVYLENNTTTGPRTASGSFLIPASAVLGNTTVRIIVAEGYSGASLTPCLAYNYGETEDFLITIQCPALAGVTSPDTGACFGNSATLNGTTSNPFATISWWDAPVGGTQVGTGTSFTTPALVSNAVYYSQEDFPGCPSSARDTVNVIAFTVDVTLAPVAATCNGLNNGSFTQTSIQCGTGPFLYSLDNGVTFGAIPTNLVAGTYNVIVQDATLATSVAYQIVITEPTAPTALTVDDVNYFDATVSWTPQGDETSWNIEYGPAGFTPGSGTIINVTATPANIPGLNPDTEYDFYVAAGCAAGSDYAGPQSFFTNAGFFTNNSQCGPGFIDISTTGTALNLTDNASTVITTVNSVSVQDDASNSVTVSNNGWISWGGITLNAWNIDLDEEEGNVYWQETNIAGDDYLIVEWFQRPLFPGIIDQNVTFEVLVNQTTNEVYYAYDDVVFGGTQFSNDYGLQGTISINGPTSITISSNDSTYLTDNSCVHFYNALCPNLTNFSALIYINDASLDWDAGLYGETNWTMIYGLAGFDPAIPGEAIDTLDLTSSDADFDSTLTQLTCYDVYIYSECQADNIASEGFLYSFCTLPYCSNPSGLAGASDIDSLEVTWNWSANPGYPATSFNIQYGMNGNPLMEVVATGIDFSDTIADTGLLGGGVYEVYVQAVCLGTNDTSDWVGPITIAMPLTNDIVCGAEALDLGTMYTFNNAGATVSVDETNIAPPATGAQTTDGWANSTLNGTTWFTFVAPASGSVRINNTATAYDGQAAVYAAADCADFNNNFLLINANDNEINGAGLAPNFTACGLTPGSTYYIMYDGTGTSGNYSVVISQVVPQAGSADPVTQICTGDVIDLFTTINGNDAGGVWSAPVAAANASITGSMFDSDALGYQTFNFQYRVTDGCASDSIISQVQIFGLSSAGTDGVVTVCKNEPVDLLSGLGGTFDFGGTWYDPSNNPMANSAISASESPGQYSYDYISGNGVCPDDSSNVVVTVLSTCDYLSIQEEVFAGVQVYPNPTTGILNIDADQAFEVKVTDANGRIIEASAPFNAGTATIDLSEVQLGVYFVELSNEKAAKVFRVVVQ
jgi:hypothetical protein